MKEIKRGPSSTFAGKRGIHAWFLWEKKLSGRNNLEDLDMNGRKLM